MSGQKRCHEDDSGQLTLGHREFIQAKKSRVLVDSNYLTLANTLDARLDTLTRRIEHMLSLLNTRLGTLEATVQNLNNAIETMQVTVCDTLSMATGSGAISMAAGSIAMTMDTSSPMDIGRDQSKHTTYYA